MAEIALFSLEHALSLAERAINSKPKKAVTAFFSNENGVEVEATKLISEQDYPDRIRAAQAVQEYFERWPDARLAGRNPVFLRPGRTPEGLIDQYTSSTMREVTAGVEATLAAIVEASRARVYA